MGLAPDSGLLAFGSLPLSETPVSADARPEISKINHGWSSPAPEYERKTAAMLDRSDDVQDGIILALRRRPGRRRISQMAPG